MQWDFRVMRWVPAQALRMGGILRIREYCIEMCIELTSCAS